MERACKIFAAIAILLLVMGFIVGSDSDCLLSCASCGAQLSKCSKGNLANCVAAIGGCWKCGQAIRGVYDVVVTRLRSSQQPMVETRIDGATGVVVQGYFRGNTLLTGTVVGQASLVRYPYGDSWEYPGLPSVRVQYSR